MQTSKYEIGANLQGLEFRRQANEILAALASSNAGNLEPASAQAGTVWLDTSNGKKHLLKIRNKANNAWGILCSIDAQSGVVDTIDAYTKKESDNKFALKDDLPSLATETEAGIAKLKNTITAKEEDAAVTEKAVAEAIEANKGIGIGQTWQDVKDQRQAGVTYTNTTGRPIFVIIKGAVNFGTPNAPVLVDDVAVGEILDHTKASPSFISFIVPQGSKYKADLPIGVSTITFWVELR